MKIGKFTINNELFNGELGINNDDFATQNAYFYQQFVWWFNEPKTVILSISSSMISPWTMGPLGLGHLENGILTIGNWWSNVDLAMKKQIDQLRGTKTSDD